MSMYGEVGSDGDYFQPWGQYGVAVSGGVKTMALTATLSFEESCTILSYDGANALNTQLCAI